MNNGDGIFGECSFYSVGDHPYYLCVSDFNGDNYNDIATSNLGFADNVSVLFNDGNGTFSLSSNYPVGLDPYSIIAGDLDGDGDIDLATANEGMQAHLAVLLNLGNGASEPYVSFNLDENPFALISIDIDNDGDLDIATVNHMYDDVTILLNKEATNISSDIDLVPQKTFLFDAYPNPFNAQTTISYELVNSAYVALQVYDILGREVETLVNKQKQAGYHQTIWNADDLSSGVYFYRIIAGDYIETKKMVLLK